MGYVRKPLRLVYVGEDFDGLIVWAKRISIGKLDELVDKAGEVEGIDDPKIMLKLADELFALLLPCLIAWNFEVADDPLDDDSPRRAVPLTMDGLREHGDLGFALATVEALMDAVGSVSAPLPLNSADGPPSLVELPMTAPN